MKKKIILIVSILFIAIIASFFIWHYTKYLRNPDSDRTFLLPQLVMSQVEINSLTAEETDLTAKILIKNQMPFSFTADSLQYKVFISNIEVMKSHYKKSIKIKGNDSSQISLPITIFNHDLTSILKANMIKHIDSVEYRLQTTFYTDIVFRKKFTVDIKRLLPLIQILEVKAEHIKIDSLNFSRAAIRLFLSLNNQNVYPMKAKHIAYELSIEGNELIRGVIPGLTEIKPKSVTELQIPIRISFKEAGKALFNLLKKGNNVNYKLRINFRMESENKILKNSQVILESSGSVKSLIKAK